MLEGDPGKQISSCSAVTVSDGAGEVSHTGEILLCLTIC